MTWVAGEGYYYGDVPEGVTINGEEIHKYMLSNFDFFDQNEMVQYHKRSLLKE